MFDIDRKAINKTASIVTSKGVDFKPRKKVLVVESDNPLPISGEDKELTGKRRGRLTVIGKAVGYGAGSNRRLVCRCDCGKYVIRKPKSIRNENNNQDRCEHCRHLAYLKRKEHFRRTGKDKDIGYY